MFNDTKGSNKKVNKESFKRLKKFKLFKLRRYTNIVTKNDDSNSTVTGNGGVYSKFRERLRLIRIARIKKLKKRKVLGIDKNNNVNSKTETSVILDDVIREIRATSGDRHYRRVKRVGIGIDDELDVSVVRKEVKNGSVSSEHESELENYNNGHSIASATSSNISNISDTVSKGDDKKVSKRRKVGFSFGVSKRNIADMSDEEKEQLLKTLGTEIIDKIKEGFEEKLDELEVLESELWLLNQQHESELELEKVREIKKKINELIHKINEIIIQYNLYAESYYMDNVIGLDDNVLIDDIIDYRTLLDSFDGEKDFIEEVQALDEFRSLYDNLVEIKADTEKLQTENEEKIGEYDIRDKKYDSIKVGMVSALDIGKKTELEVVRQNEYIKRLMEDIDEINRHEYVTSHLRGLGALLSSSFRYMRALMMSPLSGMLPGIGIQALVARRMIANAYRHLHYEEVNHVYYEAVDFDSELNHHLTDVRYVEDMVDDAIKDVGRLRDSFMQIYDRNIPGYDDTLKQIGEIEKNLHRSQNKVLLVKKNLKRSKKINENKLMRVRQLNDNARREAA